MNKIKLIIILIYILVATLYSCEDVVDVELNENDIDLISVEAYLTTFPTDNVFVKLEKSLPVTNPNVNPAINNAKVVISDDQVPSNEIILEEDGNTGIYKIPQNGLYETVTGRNYDLSITMEDGVEISAREYLQKTEPLDSLKINLSARGNFDFLGVFINSQETPGPGHYYKWDIYINNELLFRSDQMSLVSDELVDGNYVYDFEIFTDFYPPNEEEIKVFDIGDSVYVVQNSISKSAYEFYFGMINQAFTGSPFSVPPASLPTNLISSDGKRVLGLFSARDVSLSNLVVIDSTNYTPLVSSLNFLD